MDSVMLLGLWACYLVPQSRQPPCLERGLQSPVLYHCTGRSASFLCSLGQTSVRCLERIYFQSKLLSSQVQSGILKNDHSRNRVCSQTRSQNRDWNNQACSCKTFNYFTQQQPWIFIYLKLCSFHSVGGQKISESEHDPVWTLRLRKGDGVTPMTKVAGSSETVAKYRH